MASGVLVPLKVVPSFEGLINVLFDVFNEFSIKTSDLSLGVQGTRTVDLEKCFTNIAQMEKGTFCWLSFNYLTKEERDIEGFPYMGGVETRGDKNKLLLTLVTYALCKNYGSVIFNDEGYLGNKYELTLSDIKDIIKDLILTSK